MTASLVAAGAVAVSVVVLLLVVAVAFWWIRSVGDIFWMAFLRPRLVTIVLLSIATATMLLVAVLGAGVATTVAVALLVPPLLARPLCNQWEVSRWRRRSSGLKHPKSLFDVVRLEQQEVYTAPVVAPQ